MHIPKNIKIGGIRYTVKTVDLEKLDEKNAVATFDVLNCSINIAKGKPMYMQQALMHEIFHALNGGYDEQIVEFFAQAMFQVITDNPQVFQGGERND